MKFLPIYIKYISNKYNSKNKGHIISKSANGDITFMNKEHISDVSNYTTFIAFDGVLSDDILNNTSFPNRAVFTSCEAKNYSDIYNLYDELSKDFKHDKHSELKCSVLLYKLLIIMHFCLIPDYNSEFQYEKSLLAPIFELIHNSSHSIDISLQTMSDLTGLSVMHISRSFKKVLNDTPAHFLAIKRLKDAKKYLLTKPDMNIADIASEAGFISLTNFNSMFKREYGITPHDYRNKYINLPIPDDLKYYPEYQPLYITNARNYENIDIIDRISIACPAYRLTIVTDGTGLFTDETGNTYVLKKDDMFLNTPFMKYKFEAVSRPFSAIDISFQGTYENEIISYFELEGQTAFCNTLGFPYDFQQSISYIWRNFWTFEKEALLECSLLIYEIILKLYELKHYNYDKKINSKLQPAIDIIEMFYMHDISITELADSIGYSVSAFTSDFKAAFGVSPKKYLIKFRLNKASDLLKKYPEMSLNNISKRCGFSSVSYFCSSFRKSFNMSPSEYRKNNK